MRCRLQAILILLLAALVRLWGLGGQSLWLDEAFSHFFATLPLATAWQAMVVDAVHPPLYYLLLRPWLALAGASEFALRFPSAMVGVLTVAILYRAGRSWLGRQAAGWAALLLTLNPFHVWYSQEARMYALLGLLSLAVLVAFWRWLNHRRPRAWMLFIGISALAYLVHYFALYLPLVEFVFLVLTFRRHHRAVARWTAAQALAVLPLAAWLTVLYTTAGGTFGIGWIARPRLADLLRTAWSFGMAYDARLTPSVVVGLLAWGGLLLASGWRGRERTLLWLALALPPLITFLLAQRRPTYVDRFFIGSLPPFLLLAGAGLARTPRWPRRVVGLALAGLSLWGLARLHTDPLFAKEDWRGAAAYLEEHEAAGDGLALRYAQSIVPFGYYYRGALDWEVVTMNQETMPPEEIAAGRRRLWLLFRGRHSDLHHLARSEPFVLERDEAEPAILAWIVQHPPKETMVFSGVTLALFELGK